MSKLLSSLFLPYKPLIQSLLDCVQARPKLLVDLKDFHQLVIATNCLRNLCGCKISRKKQLIIKLQQKIKTKTIKK